MMRQAGRYHKHYQNLKQSTKKPCPKTWFFLLLMALKQKDIITVIPFKTYGTQKQVYLKGMVFKGIGFNDSSGLLAFFFDRWKQSIFKKVKDILLEIKLESQSSFSIRKIGM